MAVERSEIENGQIRINKIEAGPGKERNRKGKSPQKKAPKIEELQGAFSSPEDRVRDVSKGERRLTAAQRQRAHDKRENSDTLSLRACEDKRMKKMSDHFCGHGSSFTFLVLGDSSTLPTPLSARCWRRWWWWCWWLYRQQLSTCPLTLRRDRKLRHNGHTHTHTPR